MEESVLSLEMEDMDSWLVDVPDAQQLEACVPFPPLGFGRASRLGRDGRTHTQKASVYGPVC